MYNAYIVKIKELRKHSNADRLKVATVFGNQVIVGLNTVEGDIGVYFPTDGKLSKEFAELNNLVRKKDENGNNIGGYLDPEKRHIRALSLRGEQSDGLWLSLDSLKSFGNISDLKEGDLISTFNGKLICEKYVPPVKLQKGFSGKYVKKEKVNLFPTFAEHVDTEQLAYNLKKFKKGDNITLSLKMHGTSQRTGYLPKSVKIGKFKKFILNLFKIKPKEEYEYITGTRRVVLHNLNKNSNGGFYGNDIFRALHHNKFIGKLKKGETIYYEVVGYTDSGALIMGEVDNKKTGDKEFIKTYGRTTKYTYGCESGESEIYVYRITMTNEDGDVIEYPTHLIKTRCEELGVNMVPIFETFNYTTEKALMKKVNLYESGVDPIGKTHIREGIIARIENRPTFTVLKHKNYFFKVLEGIVKTEATEADIEENQ